MPEDNRYVDNRFQHQQQQNREQNQQLHTHGIKRLVRNPFFRIRQTLWGSFIILNLLHFKRDCALASCGKCCPENTKWTADNKKDQDFVVFHKGRHQKKRDGQQNNFLIHISVSFQFRNQTIGEKPFFRLPPTLQGL